MDSGLVMAVAATVVVAIYLIGVIARGSALWYEWLFALAGAAAAVWFWITEIRLARDRRRKGP